MSLPAMLKALKSSSSYSLPLVHFLLFRCTLFLSLSSLSYPSHYLTFTSPFIPYFPTAPFHSPSHPFLPTLLSSLLFPYHPFSSLSSLSSHTPLFSSLSFHSLSFPSLQLILFPPKDLSNLYYVGRPKGTLGYEFPGIFTRDSSTVTNHNVVFGSSVNVDSPDLVAHPLYAQVQVYVLTVIYRLLCTRKQKQTRNCIISLFEQTFISYSSTSLPPLHFTVASVRTDIACTCRT